MTLNISFIHILETITLLLIIGKLFQVSKLYRQSKAGVVQSTKRNIKTSPSSSHRKVGLPKSNGIYNRFTVNHPQHNLPLPEVSFTEGLPLAEVSFSLNDEGLDFTNKKTRLKPKTKTEPKAKLEPKTESEHKLILNNYIEDFFFESSTEVIREAKVLDLRNYKADQTSRDEFITVTDEHAEVLRAFESLEKTVCLVR